MAKIFIGTINGPKIKGAAKAFNETFASSDFEFGESDSGVSNQPLNEEVMKGAKNRAKYLVALAKRESTSFDYFVGLEGGVRIIGNDGFQFNATYIIGNDNRVGQGYSSHLMLPKHVTRRIFDGEELGDILKDITEGKHSKSQGGIFGLLTNAKMTRTDVCYQSTLVALAPFLHPGHYDKN